jgi:steroid delta-isomerase
MDTQEKETVATGDHMKNVLAQYCERFTAGDVDGVVALYAADARVEDPLGSDPYVGHAAIREFYAASAGIVTLELDGRPRVAGNHAVGQLRATPNEGGGMYIETTDVMVFNDEGLITSMTAYWSPDTIYQA